MNRQTRPSELTGAAISDRDLFLVEADVIVNGKRIRHFADRPDANRGNVICDILSGEIENTRRVLSFNPAEGWCRDVSEDIARDVMAAALDANGDIPRNIVDFLEEHLGCATVANAERELQS